MRILLNLIWLLFGGLLLALGYAVAGLICFVLIVTIPFGVAAFRMASYTLWPFGRTTVPKRSAGALTLVGNIIWFIVAGWWLALGHVLVAIVLAITIIGLPFAWAHLKLAGIALWPIGKIIVPADDAPLRYPPRRT